MESVMVVGRRTCQCVAYHFNEHVFNCDVPPVMYKHAYGSMYITGGTSVDSFTCIACEIVATHIHVLPSLLVCKQ